MIIYNLLGINLYWNQSKCYPAINISCEFQHLNQEASKALSAGRRAGFEISEARAMKWITSNPARAAGIYDQTGSLKVGKNADVVVWSKNPFSVYALAEKVLIDGAIAYDREKNLLPASDFDIGIMSPNKNRIEE